MEQAGEKKGRESNAFLNSARRVSINSLNRKISAQVFNEIKELQGADAGLSDKEKIFKKYEECLESGNLIKICFDACDVEGNFTVYDKGILIMLPGSSVEKAQGRVDIYSTANMLGIELSLRIIEVDRANDKIFCEVPAATKAQVRNTIKSAIQRELSRLIEKGKTPVVWGKIIRVESRRVLVDILGQGVLGMTDVSHWQQSYTRSLMGMCQPGEYYQFEVTKKAPKIEDKETAWVLSRRNLTSNAWDAINYDNLKPGGTILVKCIEKPVNKNYWWGVSDRTPGIELMGDFTDKFNPAVGTLIEGITYKCKIKEIICTDDHKKNRFTVIPFGVIQEDMAKIGAVKQFRNSKE